MAVAKWLVEKSSSSPSCKCSTALTLSDSPALSLWFSLTWWIPADRCEQSQTDLQSIAPHFLGFDSSSAPQTILCIPCAFLLLHPQPLTWSFAAGGAHCNHQHDVLYLQLRCYTDTATWEQMLSSGKHKASFWITLGTANTSPKGNTLPQKLGFSGCSESWLFLRAMHRLKERSLKMSLAAKPDSASTSPIFLSFEAKFKTLGNHCHFIASLTNVLKSHCCQKEGQQYKIEPLTSCHWGDWSHFAFISVWTDSGLEYSQKILRNQS